MGRPLGPGMLSKAFTDGVRGCWSLYCSKDFSKVSCPLCNGHFTSHINSNIYLNEFFKTGCFSVTKYNFCYNWCYWMFYSISQVLASMNLAIIKILKTLSLEYVSYIFLSNATNIPPKWSNDHINLSTSMF